MFSDMAGNVMRCVISAGQAVSNPWWPWSYPKYEFCALSWYLHNAWDFEHDACERELWLKCVCHTPNAWDLAGKQLQRVYGANGKTNNQMASQRSVLHVCSFLLTALCNWISLKQLGTRQTDQVAVKVVAKMPLNNQKTKPCDLGVDIYIFLSASDKFHKQWSSV